MFTNYINEHYLSGYKVSPLVSHDTPKASKAFVSAQNTKTSFYKNGIDF